MSSVTVSASRTWFYFVGWMLVGTSGAMVIAGAFTIGIFFAPIAALGAILMSRRPPARVGLPGLVAGLGLPFLFVAYLNRSGPGMVCEDAERLWSGSELLSGMESVVHSGARTVLRRDWCRRVHATEEAARKSGLFELRRIPRPHVQLLRVVSNGCSRDHPDLSRNGFEVVNQR